ncbi:MAG: hypothetical protein ACYSO3_00630 [Planctomycetota bacterium]|jgi:hypothetical protein
MNLTDKKYSGYALVQEMMDTVGVVKNFDPTQTAAIAPKIQSVGRLLMTGEGSSRIFPAKNAMRKAMQWGMDQLRKNQRGCSARKKTGRRRQRQSLRLNRQRKNTP